MCLPVLLAYFSRLRYFSEGQALARPQNFGTTGTVPSEDRLGSPGGSPSQKEDKFGMAGFLPSQNGGEWRIAIGEWLGRQPKTAAIGK